MNGSYTFRLLKQQQGFLQGVGAILDLSNPRSKYNYNESETAADCESLQADWLAIGEDMQHAINQYEQETKETGSVA